MAANHSPPAPDLLDLALLAIQLRGGRVQSTDEVVKLLKKGVQHAIATGWVDQSKEKQDHPTQKDRRGLPKRVTVTWWALTDEGRTRLTQLPDPQVRAISVASLLQQVRNDLQVAAGAFRASVERRVTDGFHDLVEIVDDARRRVGAGLGTTSAGVDNRTSVPEPHGLEAQLATAYRSLTYQMKFEHGLVDIPTLFTTARASHPELVATDVVTELERLWKAGRLKLRVANELYDLTEEQRAMGVWYDGGLHYFVDWPGAR